MTNAAMKSDAVTIIRDDKFGYYYLALGLLGLSTLFLLWLASTPFGKSLRATRDNEDYAQARDISISPVQA